MNVLFLSPNFPPQFYLFCSALREEGANVIGIGDSPPHELRPELRTALSEYVFQPRLDDYDTLMRNTGYLIWRHGRIDRVDSLNEHWLGMEARLREDFNVPGPREQEAARLRSKASMAEIFAGANIPAPKAVRVESPEQLRRFAKENGYPLVLKPDVGVGAWRTFRVADEEALETALRERLEGYVVQKFVKGAITTYDGLVDGAGRIVFASSFIYSAGVMETVAEQSDIAYYTRREIPVQLEELGRRAVEAFGLRERFFHAEFFELPDGSFQALEVNIRPPGGFSTDMMNYAGDCDVYRLWARMLVGADLSGFEYERKYFVAHASRRHGVRYRRDPGELASMLGSTLVLRREIPHAFAAAMGDEVWLLRHPEKDSLIEAIRLVQERA